MHREWTSQKHSQTKSKKAGGTYNVSSKDQNGCSPNATNVDRFLRKEALEEGRKAWEEDFGNKGKYVASRKNENEGRRGVYYLCAEEPMRSESEERSDEFYAASSLHSSCATSIMLRFVASLIVVRSSSCYYFYN